MSNSGFFLSMDDIANIDVRVSAFLGKPVSCRVVQTFPSIHVYFPEIGSFSLTEMPGCCGIAISTAAYVCVDQRNKGIGTMLHHLRKDLARDKGYTMLVCTDLVDNAPQRAVLQRSGFKDAVTFTNARTGNNVALSYINLREEEGDMDDTTQQPNCS